MLMLSLDNAVDVTRRLVKDEMDDATIIRQELEQKCWFPPETDEAARELSNRIFDISPAMICEQIKTGNLKNWCVNMQTHMKMAMVQLPCWAEQQWIPCDERLPEDSGRYLISVFDGVGRRTIVAPYQPRYKAWTMIGRMAFWKVIAWMPLPDPYEPEE